MRSWSGMWAALKVCLLVCGIANSTRAQALRLYVGDSGGSEVTVIDLSSLRVSGSISVGEKIHGIAIEPNGRRLFVTVESDNTLRIIDTLTHGLIGVVKLTGRPNQCAVTPDGKYVVVPIRDKGSVEVVDVREQKVVKILPIKEPHNAVSTASNRYVYVSSMGGNEIDVIDLETLEYSEHIPVGGRPRPYVLSGDGKKAYVALANLHGFVVVDIPEKKVIQRVEMPAVHSGPPRPRQFETPDTLTHGLALTPDEKELWVTSMLDDAIYIYDFDAQKFVGSVPTGDGPNWVVFTPDGKYACVSNTDSDDVSILDVRSRRGVARVKVGKVPKRLAVGIVPQDHAKPGG
jgi:YVTN family beta-propeller protein